MGQGEGAKAKGIIFSAAMVRALLDGRKTQTRRLARVRRNLTLGEIVDHGEKCPDGYRATREMLASAPYAPGDRLYVREAHGFNHYEYERGRVPKPRPADLTDEYISYRATESDCEISHELRYRPSIHMPRWASRLWLAVTDVRVERLQLISEADAIAEGIDWSSTAHFGNAIKAYAALWDHLHGAESGNGWVDNPWIVAVSFDVHHGNIDEAGE